MTLHRCPQCRQRCIGMGLKFAIVSRGWHHATPCPGCSAPLRISDGGDTVMQLVSAFILVPAISLAALLLYLSSWRVAWIGCLIGGAILATLFAVYALITPLEVVKRP